MAQLGVFQLSLQMSLSLPALRLRGLVIMFTPPRVPKKLARDGRGPFIMRRAQDHMLARLP